MRTVRNAYQITIICGEEFSLHNMVKEYSNIYGFKFNIVNGTFKMTFPQLHGRKTQTIILQKEAESEDEIIKEEMDDCWSCIVNAFN